MQKRIVYSRPDGGVSVVILAPHSTHADGDEQVWIEQIIAKDVPPDATDIRVIDASEVPTDRTFRGAWVLGESGIGCDMAKAREIHMSRIRAARDKELAKQDIEQLKGNDVAARKQELRDLPQTFDLSGASTPDALKALWPSGLPR